MKSLTKLYKTFVYQYKKKIDLDKIAIKSSSLNSLFNYYETDKGSKDVSPYSKIKNGEKVKGHGFAKFYEKYFKNLKKKRINILEIGVWEGASTASFYHYFEKAELFAIDRNFKFKYCSKRINFFFCDTTSLKDLSKFKNYVELKKNISFDIIIDDGSHIFSNILKNLSYFFNYLKVGGIYVIEDYKHPSYFSYLQDIKGHISIDKVLFLLKKNIIFKSKILSRNKIRHLIKNIKKIFTHKGNCIKNGKNISDIAFIYKKN
tara:strand:+ start:2531 stop:3313 length:783 start_codon:yes stop_codon:yes gene_type:complete